MVRIQCLIITDDEKPRKKQQLPTGFSLFQENYQNPFKSKPAAARDLDEFLETELLVNAQIVENSSRTSRQ